MLGGFSSSNRCGSLAGAEDSCLGTLCTRFCKEGWGQTKGNLESQLKHFSVFPGCIRFKEESSKNNDLGRNIPPQGAEKDQPPGGRLSQTGVHILQILSRTFVSVAPDARSPSTPSLPSPSLPSIGVQLRYHLLQNISPSNNTQHQHRHEDPEPSESILHDLAPGSLHGDSRIGREPADCATLTPSPPNPASSFQ